MKRCSNFRPLLFVGIITCVCAASVHAASVSVIYSFTVPGSGDTVDARLAPSSVSLPNLTASSVSFNGFTSPTTAANSTSTTIANTVLLSTTQGTAPDTNGGHLATYFPNTTVDNDTEAEVALLGNYFQITLTPAAGYVLDLSTLLLDYTAAATTSGRTFFVRYNHSGVPNNFAGPSLTGGTVSTTAWTEAFGTAGNLDPIPLVNGDAGESVTLRFFTYRSSTTNVAQNLRFDDITISGDLSVIPEPSSSLIAAGFLLAGLSRRSRH